MAKSFEPLAEKTCHDFLTAPQLRAICRWRGFSPPGGDKQALASFVAPRLLESAGVAESINSLEEPWLLALHRIAWAQDGARLTDLASIVLPKRRHYDLDLRAFFRKVGDGLLSRGVVLLEDMSAVEFWRASRYERFLFHVPDCHRAALPPFPVATRTLGANTRRGDFFGFCRKALQAAARRAEAGRETTVERPLDRVQSAFSIRDGGLFFKQNALSGVTALHAAVRKEWTSDTQKRGRPQGETAGARDGAAYILSRLPRGEGLTNAELESALSRFGFVLPRVELDALCQTGYEIGLLLRDEQQTEPVHRLAPAGDVEHADGALAFQPTQEGIRVLLESSGIAPLLELASVSRAEVVRGALHLAPDGVLLGRNWTRFVAQGPLEQVRTRSAAFGAAVKQVRSRQGKLILHEGLSVLRIEDLALRTLLLHELGAGARALGGDYLAAPRDLWPHVERLVAKEGFAPRILGADGQDADDQEDED